MDPRPVTTCRFDPEESNLASAQLSLSYGQAFVAPDLRRHRSSMSVRVPEQTLMRAKGACAVISDVVAGAQSLVSAIAELPAEVLLGAGLLLGGGIPLSVWVLYRTLRTPTRGRMYAH